MFATGDHIKYDKFLFLVQNFFIITAPTFDPLKMIKLKKKKKKTKPQVVKILIYICRKKSLILCKITNFHVLKKKFGSTSPAPGTL